MPCLRTVYRDAGRHLFRTGLAVVHWLSFAASQGMIRADIDTLAAGKVVGMQLLRRRQWTGLLLVVFLLSVVLSGCTSKSAYQYTSVAGKLTDPMGQPVVGAGVLIGEATAVTDEQGQFYLSAVRTDHKEMKILRSGYKPLAVPITLGTEPQTLFVTCDFRERQPLRDDWVDFAILSVPITDTNLDQTARFSYLSWAEASREAEELLGLENLSEALDYLSLEELAVICQTLRVRHLAWITENLPDHLQVFNSTTQSIASIPIRKGTAARGGHTRKVYLLEEVLWQYLQNGGAEYRLGRDEARLAEQVQAYMERQYAITYQGKDIQRIRTIADKIIAVSERANLEYTFGILEAPEYNAYALPGGYVYITRPMLEMMESDSELAAVLAHEITHVVHMHAVAMYRRQLAMTVAAVFLAAATGDVESSFDIIGFLDSLITEGYSKAQEFDADQTGLLYISRAGYEPQGMVTLLEKLLALERKLTGGRRTYSRTHPQTESRIAEVKGGLAKVHYYDFVASYF